MYNTLMQDEDKDQQQAGWIFKSGAKDQSYATNTHTQTSSKAGVDHEASISWSASEYISNPKDMGWFTMLAVAFAAVAVIVYLVTSDFVSTIVIITLGIIVGVFAARQPHSLEYRLDSRGIQMGQRFSGYEIFKSFSVVEDGAFSHISLLPLKRFMPPLAIHYPPEQEEKIIDTLADYLPFEEHKRDLIDSFSRKIRF